HVAAALVRDWKVRPEVVRGHGVPDDLAAAPRPRGTLPRLDAVVARLEVEPDRAVKPVRESRRRGPVGLGWVWPYVEIELLGRCAHADLPALGGGKGGRGTSQASFAPSTSIVIS